MTRNARSTTPGWSGGRPGHRVFVAVASAIGVIALIVVPSARSATAVPAKVTARRALAAMAVAPTAQTVAAGSATVFAIRVTARPGFRGTVSVELRGLPAGATGRLTPGSRRGEARVDIATAAATPGGTYTLQFVASTTGDQRAVSATLTVIGAPPAPPAPPPPAPAPPSSAPPPPAPPTSTIGSNYTIAAEPLLAAVDAGNAASFIVRLAYVGGFDGSVDYRVDGLPAGVTASFSPNPSVGSTVLTVAAAATTTAGNYPLTITATNRGLVRATAVVLTVRAVSDFVLVVDAAARTILPGQGVAWTVTPSPAGDATSLVTYSVGGIPAGATASFSPNPTNGTTTLTIQTSTGTLNGVYAITVTGTRGTFVRSASLQLTVGSPFAFALAAQPTTATVARTSSAIYRIVITQGTYTGAVVISASGVPNGGAVGLSTNSDGSVSLLVTTSSSTPTGTYVITITGSGGGASAAIQVTLIVT